MSLVGIPEPTSRNKTHWLALLKEAVLGSRQDFTAISMNRAIFLLAVPMVLEMVMESLFAVVDVFYVSRVGVNALATVALTESVMMLVWAIAIGLSMSATAFVSRRAGEKNLKAASDCAVQALFLGFMISIPLGILGTVFAPEIFALSLDRLKLI